MRLIVDRDLCQGHGRCLQAVPELVIDLDTMGQPALENDGEFGPELAAKVQLAVGNCPESALSIADGGRP